MARQRQAWRKDGSGGSGLSSGNASYSPYRTHATTNQLPNEVPTLLALSIQAWFGGTVLSLPATSAIGTGLALSPRAATITPKTFSLINSAHIVPRRVASRRSPADGVPPR